ncbi:MAG: hypothetical protein KF682_05865 [Nitrospira sp.]|nr:hypothetical protein [Nitrospira sp.]
MELALTIIGLIISSIAGWFTVLPYIEKTRRNFESIQPKVVIGVNYVICSGAQYTAILKLHNIGKTAAYKVKVAMDHHLEEQIVSVIHPLHPGFNEYEVGFEFGQSSPLRKALFAEAFLRITYDDLWNYRHEITYLIGQSRRSDGLFDPQIHTEKPTLKRPKVSFLKMQKYLKETTINT